MIDDFERVGEGDVCDVGAELVFIPFDFDGAGRHDEVSSSAARHLASAVYKFGRWS
jgi:hypothetical protein